MASNNIPALKTKGVVDSTFDPTQTADFWIKVEDETIVVHKDLLISAAPYFHCLFESGMQEVQNQTIIVNCYRPIIVKTVIQYMYGKITDFEWQDITDYIDIVESWQMLELKDTLDEYICKCIDHDNYIDWFFMAHAYMLSKVMTQTRRFLLTHLPNVSTRPEFLELDRTKLLKLLCVEEMHNISCEAKLEACIKWVQADEITRQCHYMDLIEHIGLKCCSQNFIRVVIQAYKLKDVGGNIVKQYIDLLLNFVIQICKNTQNVGGDLVERYLDPLLTQNNQDATDKGHSIIVAGYHESSNFMKAVKISLQDMSIEELHSIPPECIIDIDSVSCWTPYGMFVLSRKTYPIHTFRGLLHFPSMSFVHLPDLPAPVDGLHAVYSDDKVYVLCKSHKRDTSVLAKMYTLDLRTLQWSRCDDLPNGMISFHCKNLVCAVGSRIYVITTWDTFYVYDTVLDMWKCLGKLPVQTHIFTSYAVAVDSDMYIINGRDQQCVKYNTSTDQWIRIKGPSVVFQPCGAMYINGKIIAVSSEDFYADKIYAEPNCIVLYDIQKDEWETSSLEFPGPIGKICMNLI